MKHWNGYEGRLVTECREKWFYEFDWLRRIPTYHAYLSILGMAKSVNHLEKLHEMMPNDTRLLRHDWEKVADFWKYFFAGPETKKYRGKLEEWLLEEHFADWRNEGHGCAGSFPTLNATSYYAEQIRKQSSVTALYHFMSYWDGKSRYNGSRRVLTSPEAYGHGDFHFQGSLFGKLVKFAFRFYKGGGSNGFLLAWFMLKESQLTEPLTHNIISKLPDYQLLRYRVSLSSIPGSNHLHIAFELAATAMWKFVEPFRDDFLAREQFPRAAAEFLRDEGIPVEGNLCPIIYTAVDNDEDR